MAFGRAQHLTILFEIGSSGSCLRRGPARFQASPQGDGHINKPEPSQI
jgi:hypothetical protein